MELLGYLLLAGLLFLLWRASRNKDSVVETPRAESAESEAADSAETIHLPIEDSLDLHAFAPRDVASVVEEYLEQTADKGFEEVRIIHGRGKGVQREIVRRVLQSHSLVADYRDAPPERGGWGATVVRLRRPSPDARDS